MSGWISGFRRCRSIGVSVCSRSRLCQMPVQARAAAPLFDRALRDRAPPARRSPRAPAPRRRECLPAAARRARTRAGRRSRGSRCSASRSCAPSARRRPRRNRTSASDGEPLQAIVVGDRHDALQKRAKGGLLAVGERLVLGGDRVGGLRVDGIVADGVDIVIAGRVGHCRSRVPSRQRGRRRKARAQNSSSYGPHAPLPPRSGTCQTPRIFTTIAASCASSGEAARTLAISGGQWGESWVPR